jgi:hypothetical protein
VSGTKVKKMTRKEQQLVQDARVFAALCISEPNDAEYVADYAGDSDANWFCTASQATAALKRFKKLGLVEEAGPDPAIKRSRRSLKRWKLTLLGRSMRDFIIEFDQESGGS